MTRENKESSQPVRGSKADGSSRYECESSKGLTIEQARAVQTYNTIMYNLGFATWTGNTNFASRASQNYSSENH